MVRITTHEGARSLTLGGGTRGEYAAAKRALISPLSKVGASRFGGRSWITALCGGEGQ